MWVLFLGQSWFSIYIICVKKFKKKFSYDVLYNWKIGLPRWRNLTKVEVSIQRRGQSTLHMYGIFLLSSVQWQKQWENDCFHSTKREARNILDGAAKQMPQMFAQTNGKHKEANTMLTVLIFNNKFFLTMQCHSSSWDIPQANFKFLVWKKACSGVHFTLFPWSSVKLASLFFCYNYEPHIFWTYQGPHR